VQTGVHPLVRARRVTLSLRTFRRLAVAAAAMLLIVVATGATVRLTASGLGCLQWPGCEGGVTLPEKGFHSYVEFGNRVVAFITICATLGAWIGALLSPTSRRLRWLAFGTFFGTMLQAPLGAITIYYDLNPYLVLSHFLLSVAVLTLGVVLALEATALLRGHAEPAVPRWVRFGGMLVALACGVLLVSGTLATAAGPHPGSTVVRRLWSFEPAVYWHVRATAVFGISFAIMLAWLARTHSRHLRTALGVLALLAVQMTIGEIQYRTKLPWWLVLMHVTTASAVWAAMTAFAYSLWRPLRRIDT
jgi:cytochrome c oxidase assembly protein subunit 15